MVSQMSWLDFVALFEMLFIKFYRDRPEYAPVTFRSSLEEQELIEEH